MASKKHVGLEISEKDADDDSSDVVDVVGIENDMTRLKIAEKNGGIVNVSDRIVQHIYLQVFQLKQRILHQISKKSFTLK